MKGLKKFLLIVLYGCFHLMVSAQQVKLSDPIEINSRTDDFMVIGDYRQFIATYVFTEQTPWIYLYNQQMEKEKSIEIPFFNNPETPIHIIITNGNLHVFFEEETSAYLCLKHTQLNAEFNWSPVITVDSVTKINRRDKMGYRLISNQYQSVLVAYIEIDQPENHLLRACIIPEQLTQIRTIEIPILATDQHVSNQDVLSSEGTAFILLQNKVNIRGSASELQVIALYPDGTHREVPIAIENHYVSSAQILYDKQNKRLYIGGFYQDSKGNNPKGVFSLHIDEQMHLSEIIYTALSLKLTQANADLRDYRLKHLAILDNGCLEICAEKYYQQTRTISSGTSISMGMMSMQDNTRTVQEFNYEDILLVNTKTDGSISWSQTILKDQTTQDDGGIYSSFVRFAYPLGHIYFFNDMQSRHTRLMAAYTNSKGSVSVKEVQTPREADQWDQLVRSGKQINSQRLIIPCINKNKLCFMQVAY